MKTTKQKIFFLTLILLSSIACKKESDRTKELNASEQTDISENKAETISKAESDYTSIINDFIDCKSSATQRSQCRNQITQVISETHSLDEFKDSDNNFVIYDSIYPIIKRSKKWQHIGFATNQQTINKAIEVTNKGGVSLIIDTSNSYGHVVMVLPGETQKSGSWNMELPQVLSLLNSNPDKSFNDKSLAYAFKKSEALQIFIRE